MIYQLDVRSGANRRVKIAGAASRRHFYAISDDEGNRSNQIEGFLAMAESHSAPALARLLSDPQHLSEADRGTLAFFVALLDQRTPGATTRSSQAANTVMRMLLSSAFSDVERFAERYRKIFPPADSEEEASDEQIEEFASTCSTSYTKAASPSGTPTLWRFKSGSTSRGSSAT